MRTGHENKCYNHRNNGLCPGSRDPILCYISAYKASYRLFIFFLTHARHQLCSSSIIMIVNRSSFSDIPPFFEPGMPPASFPLPIAQTEIGKMQSSGKLLAQEEIGPKSSNLHSKNRFSPYYKPAVQQPSISKVSTPHRSGTPPATPSTKAPLDSDSLSSLSDLDEDEDSLISKPEGEAGRPGRGGYNIEETLSWKRKDFMRLKVCGYFLFSEVNSK
jgi:hypothetical protein